MTTLGHEILGVVAETIGIKRPDIAVGSMVSIIPHFWCGVCLPCMTGHTNFCDFRKHIGFEHTSGGGFAQYIAVPEQNLVVYPQGDDDLAFYGSRSAFAILEPITCCIHGFELMKANPGDPEENPYKDKNILIFGAGSIGCMHGRLAKIKEAAQVVLVDLESITREKREKIQGINMKTDGNGRAGQVFDEFITYACGSYEGYDEEKYGDAKYKGEDDVKFQETVDKAWEDLRETIARNGRIKTDRIDVVILAASSRVAYELAVRLVGDRGKVMFFSGLPQEERRPMEIGGQILDIHHIHYRDRIVEVEDKGRSFTIVGAQGFYPGYNGVLWNDFSLKNMKLIARMNPAWFVTNPIRLEEDDGENQKKLVKNLKEEYKKHLKNLLIIGHKPNRKQG